MINTGALRLVPVNTAALSSLRPPQIRPALSQAGPFLVQNTLAPNTIANQSNNLFQHLPTNQILVPATGFSNLSQLVSPRGATSEAEIANPQLESSFDQLPEQTNSNLDSNSYFDKPVSSQVAIDDADLEILNRTEDTIQPEVKQSLTGKCTE